MYLFFVFFFPNIFLICTPDIEANSEFSSFCQWNLNGLTSHKLVKISLLQTRITRHKHEVIYLFLNFLKSYIENDNGRLKKIDDYNPIRSDHPNGSKNGFCIYFKKCIPLI